MSKTTSSLTNLDDNLGDTLRPTLKAYRAEVAESTSEDTPIDYDAAHKQFQQELLWCINYLERTVADNKSAKDKMDDTWAALQILKSDDQPIIFKRLLMRTYCGDYNVKMTAAEKRLGRISNRMNLIPTQTKSSILRKSMQAGDNVAVNHRKASAKKTGSKTSIGTSSSSSKSSTKKAAKDKTSLVASMNSPITGSESESKSSTNSSSYTTISTTSSSQ